MTLEHLDNSGSLDGSCQHQAKANRSGSIAIPSNSSDHLEPSRRSWSTTTSTRCRSTSKAWDSTRQHRRHRGEHRWHDRGQLVLQSDDKISTFGTGGVDDAEDATSSCTGTGIPFRTTRCQGSVRVVRPVRWGGLWRLPRGKFFESLENNKLSPVLGPGTLLPTATMIRPISDGWTAPKNIPKTWEGEEHADGEIWSACLWTLRGKLGQKKTDKLVFAHHFLIPSTASFKDAAQALITADQNNNGRFPRTKRRSGIFLFGAGFFCRFEREQEGEETGQEKARREVTGLRIRAFLATLLELQRGTASACSLFRPGRYAGTRRLS